MNCKLYLLVLILLSSVSGIAHAQTMSVYTGTFTNSTLTQSGVVKMSLTIVAPDSIKGYMNFSELPAQSPLCGAGSYKGRIINTDSLYFSFSSHDTDNNCGFDLGWLFSLKGRFYASRDSIAGFYEINNANNEMGVFNLKRPATAVVILDKDHPRIYPNPANGKVTVELPQYVSGAAAIITDQLGAKVFVKQLVGNKTDLELNVPDGVYFLSITSSGLTFKQKLIIGRSF